MTKTPVIPALIVALLLTSCAIFRGTARPSTAVTSTGEYSQDKLIPEVKTHQPASPELPPKLPNDDPANVATPTTETPVFTPSLNAYCRSGPDVSRSQISLAMKGQSYAIHGRDPNGTWYLISVSASAKCWVSASTGSTSGDTSGVRVIQPTVTLEAIATEPPTDIPTEPPLACVTLLAPINGADLPLTGKVTFSWTPINEVGTYVLNIILPSGETLSFETDQTFRDRYMEAFVAGGEYQWQVIAQRADGSKICVSEVSTFDKPAYEKPKGGDGDDDGGGGCTNPFRCGGGQ